MEDNITTKELIKTTFDSQEDRFKCILILLNELENITFNDDIDLSNYIIYWNNQLDKIKWTM